MKNCLGQIRKKHLSVGLRFFSYVYYAKKKIASPAGNRIPVSRVTGGDTHHYTTEDFDSQERVGSSNIIHKNKKVVAFVYSLNLIVQD